MKWYLLIGAVVIIGLGIVFYYSGSNVPVDTVEPAPVFPTSTPIVTPGEPSVESAQTIMIGAKGGGRIEVKDFIHNKVTVADSVNPGSYVLAGELGYCLPDGTCPVAAPTKNFTVSYNENTNFFNIVLLKEPLGAVRAEVEQFLATELGISEQQLCKLHYSLGAPYWVNSLYDDKNLGFSFCAGATKLPR